MGSRMFYTTLPTLLLLVANTSMAHTGGIFKLKAIKDKALSFNNTFLNLTDVAVVDQCFSMCLEHCRCLSFQICQNQVCQLCSTTNDLTSSDLVKKDGCVYYYYHYDFEKDIKKLAAGQWQQRFSCCSTSNPCLNNGLCEPEAKTCHTRRRFRCKCPPGYKGELCGETITSCRGYNDGRRVAGKYKVYDANMRLFEVFCDFDPSGMSWTLIQSYNLTQKREVSSFRNDTPLNEDVPGWHRYRLSKSRMQSIQKESSKWRITCRYDTDGLNYTDYVRGSNAETDILTLDKDTCKKVEFINIRGYNCTGCTALLAQSVKRKWSLHIDSYFSVENPNCSFQVSDSSYCSESGEDNFGYYYCVNPSHRCSATDTSTTQTWLGGI